MTRGARLGLAASALVLLAFVAVLVVLRSAGSDGQSAPGRDDDCEPATPERLEVEVLRTLPHDPEAYTQGLVVFDGRLFESTGRTGESTVRQVDPDDGEVLRRVPLPPEQFGEGLTATEDGRLVQLTWTDGVAHEWDPDTLELLGEFTYSGEGWGLTTLEDGTLAMTDGSDELTLRDPDDFAELDRRVVRRLGGPADRLNELEWDGDALWANRYTTDELLRIDPDCAVVTGVADLSSLRRDATAAADEAGTRIDVTNGIAHLPGTDRYLVTGKWWPTMYEVRIG